MAVLVTCKNCNNQFAGKFCNQCGEKVYTDHDKSLKHFFEDAFHFITHFDSKFFKTFWLVLSKPGLVSYEYCRGIRKKYFKPVSLFLVGVIIYLLFPMIQGMNIAFGNHLYQDNAMYLTFAEKWAQAKAAQQQITIVELGKHFDAISPKVSKLLLFIIIPLTGIALRLIFYKRRKYYFDHFTLAAEINTFFLFVIFIVMPLVFMLVSKFLWWCCSVDFGYGDDWLYSGIQVVLLFVFCIAAFRRFYEVKLWKAILKSLLFLAALSFIAFVLYRLILFCTVMLLI